MQFKVCPKCKKEKPLSEFSNSYYGRYKLNKCSYCKECSNKSAKEWRKNNPRRDWVLSSLKNHQRRGCTINITKDELLSIAKKTNRCPMCNNLLDWSVGTKNGIPQKNSPSLDRKYNEWELRKDNTWIICYKCNEIKNNLPWYKFIKYCEMIYKKFRGD